MGSLTAQITEISNTPLPFGMGAFSLKNPSDVQETFDVDKSVGEHDSRRPVFAGEEVYESIVSLDSANCTGTVVDIEGYDLVNEGSLIATAAHCVDDSDPNGI